MRRFILSPAAEDDISAISAWTVENFGEQATLRYESLLAYAIRDVTETPDQPGATHRPEIASQAWVYHLLHSRDRVPRSIGRVKLPRHFLLYRVINDVVEIARVLHDSVDLARHLPESFRSDFDQ
jgi:toxin ParE1/3/4